MEVLDTTTADAPVDAQSPTDQTEHDERSEEEEELNCSACGQAVTRLKLRTRVGGRHEHTCVNPAGVLFEIGCFSEADGCREVGAESDDFTWFDGYTWQVAVCVGCHAHLGWRFWSADAGFYGLILNRLA